MVRDLVEISVNMVRHERTTSVQEKAKVYAEERILDILIPPAPRPDTEKGVVTIPQKSAYTDTREKMRAMLHAGKLDERVVELEVSRQGIAPIVEIFGQGGIEELGIAVEEAFGGRFPRRKKKRKMPVKEAIKYLQNEEAEKLVDMDEVINEARRRAENSGIIFVDEIDKIAGGGVTGGPDVSREGVQRDLLPIVEGSNVMTKYGMIKTNHILFIAAGAFHNKKPSDLIPEMQGRFPIRVELSALSEDDFRRILVEPENSLIKQYVALLASDGVELEFSEDAIDTIAQIAGKVNETTENIGARRLHTVMTKLLEDLLYNAPATDRKAKITKAYVDDKLGDIVRNVDVSRYIL
jgi:ATP-dependent HslUV protease ATP-binding subunit HslU